MLLKLERKGDLISINNKDRTIEIETPISEIFEDLFSGENKDAKVLYVDGKLEFDFAKIKVTRLIADQGW